MSWVTWKINNNFFTAKNVVCKYCGYSSCIHGKIFSLASLTKSRLLNVDPIRAYRVPHKNVYVCASCFNRM